MSFSVPFIDKYLIFYLLINKKNTLIVQIMEAETASMFSMDYRWFTCFSFCSEPLHRSGLHAPLSSPA